MAKIGRCIKNFDKTPPPYEFDAFFDASASKSFISGKMVKPDVIAENLGLRVGANLAEIDFAEKRREILKKIPTLRTISISRVMPAKLRVVAEERTPVARLGVRGQRRPSGRVVDAEGVVFICQRDTQLLPTITEPLPPGVQPGHHIKARMSAALQLIEACRDPEFSELGVQDVDVSGSENYGDAEVVDAAGISLGDKLYSFRASDAEGEITFLCPYIKSADVRRHAPTSVTITLEDDAPAYVANIWGDTVLLSPACTSYDAFPDFAARGDRFRALCRGKENE